MIEQPLPFPGAKSFYRIEEYFTFNGVGLVIFKTVVELILCNTMYRKYLLI